MSVIQSSNATLKTLQVSIQSLTVNNKQMTLAVFRQLPEMILINDKGQLLPEIKLWGLVRYQIKDSGNIWAVCEEGGTLYRAKIPKAWSRDHLLVKCPVSYDHNNPYGWADDFLKNHFATSDKIETFLTQKGKSYDTVPYPPDFLDEEGRLVFWRRAPNWRSKWRRHEECEPEVLSEIENLLNLYKATLPFWQDEVNRMLRAEKAISKNLDSVRTVLFGLPQLFIAV